MLRDFIDSFSGRNIDPDNREHAVQELIERCGYAAAALTILPIPGSEILGVMPIHVGMVVGVGHAYNQSLTRESASELVMRIGATVGLSLVGSRLATTAAKLVLPGLGGLISAPFMYASTLAIGRVACIYFERGGEVSEEEMRRVYKRQSKAARRTFDPRRARSSEARDMAREAAEQGSDADDAPDDAQARPQAPPVPAPPPVEPKEDPLERLERLKKMLDRGLIDQGEYDTVKARILSDM